MWCGNVWKVPKIVYQFILTNFQYLRQWGHKTKNNFLKSIFFSIIECFSSVLICKLLNKVQKIYKLVVMEWYDQGKAQNDTILMCFRQLEADKNIYKILKNCLKRLENWHNTAITTAYSRNNRIKMIEVHQGRIIKDKYQKLTIYVIFHIEISAEKWYVLFLSGKPSKMSQLN